MDFMSEGLILLSNDGDLTRYLELPSSKFVRIYEVIVKGPVRARLIIIRVMSIACSSIVN